MVRTSVKQLEGENKRQTWREEGVGGSGKIHDKTATNVLVPPLLCLYFFPETPFLISYKCTNKLVPAYICNMFELRISNYDLRVAKGKLSLAKPRTDYLKRSFSYSGALLWNNLPEELRTANSLGLFKKREEIVF